MPLCCATVVAARQGVEGWVVVVVVVSQASVPHGLSMMTAVHVAGAPHSCLHGASGRPALCVDALPCPSLLIVVRDGTYWGLASVNNLNLMPREGELAHGLVRVLLHDLLAAAAAAADTLAALLRHGCVGLTFSEAGGACTSGADRRSGVGACDAAQGETGCSDLDCVLEMLWQC